MCPALPFVPSCHNSRSEKNKKKKTKEKAQVFAGASKLSTGQNHFEAFMLCQLWQTGIGADSVPCLWSLMGIFLLPSHSKSMRYRTTSHEKYSHNVAKHLLAETLYLANLILLEPAEMQCSVLLHYLLGSPWSSFALYFDATHLHVQSALLLLNLL